MCRLLRVQGALLEAAPLQAALLEVAPLQAALLQAAPLQAAWQTLWREILFKPRPCRVWLRMLTRAHVRLCGVLWHAHGPRRTPHSWPASCATYCTRAAPHAASLACQLCDVLHTGCAARRIPGLPAVRRTVHGLRHTPHTWPASCATYCTRAAPHATFLACLAGRRHSKRPAVPPHPPEPHPPAR